MCATIIDIMDVPNPAFLHTAKQEQLEQARRREETAEEKISVLQSEVEARDTELSDVTQRMEAAEAEKVNGVYAVHSKM